MTATATDRHTLDDVKAAVLVHLRHAARCHAYDTAAVTRLGEAAGRVRDASTGDEIRAAVNAATEGEQ